ncbi:hypothetical protein V6Z96_006089 [Aspergillus fumigatus]
MCVSLQVSHVDGAALPVPTKTRARGQLVTSGASRVPSGCLDPVSVPGARRPAGIHPGACECVARPASVPWRAPLPAGGRPAQGAPANWSPCRPPAAAPHHFQLGQHWPPRAAYEPPLPPSSPLSALLAPPFVAPRARDSSARLEGARLQPPPTDSLNRDPSARRQRPSPTRHRDLARPIIVRANVPGSERSFRGRPTCAGRPRAARAAMCPSQLVTALRHQAAAARGSPRPSRPANWRESMEVEIPRGTGRHRCPRVSGERCLGPPPSARRCQAR